MSDYVIGFMVGYSALIVAFVICRRVNAWMKRRAAEESRVCEEWKELFAEQDRARRALYSDDYLDSLIRQRTAASPEFPKILAEAVKRREAERKAQHLFALGSVEVSAPSAAEDLDFDGVTRALTGEPNGIVFKPGKPLNPVPLSTVTKEACISRLAYLTEEASIARVRTRIGQVLMEHGLDEALDSDVLDALAAAVVAPYPADPDPKDGES